VDDGAELVDAGTRLPPGRHLDLPGRGTTFIRELPGPGAGAPTVVLLHGLSVDADLNWFPSYEALGRVANVVAIDHRGHGRGIRTREAFRLADCADDVLAVCDVLGVQRVIPVGYSMGGPIALLLWHRHRSRVAGLVLCATSTRFGRDPARRAARFAAPGLATFARITPAILPPNPISRQLALSRIQDPGMRQWIATRERRTDPMAVLQAAAAVARYNGGEWIGEVDVPTAVVVTQFDRLVPRSSQEWMADRIPGATVHRVLGDHAVCVTRPDLFVPALLDALGAVMRGAGHR
jgi:pimeloyl-ACP methyl ester carboxylesterase